MKKLNPISGMLSTFQAMANPSLLDASREDVFREELPTHVVDTCCAFDTGAWETGVQPNGESFIIVEQYENRDAAKAGHDKWVQSLKDNPTQTLPDVNVWDF